MTTEHPITPTPKLVMQWLTEVADLKLLTPTSLDYLATQAARWGADQELEACCEWTAERTTQWSDGTWPADALCAARRPKPLSLAEQALVACERSAFGIPGDRDIIRCALERLQELEKGNE